MKLKQDFTVYIELDKRNFYLKQANTGSRPTVTSHKSIKTCTKIAARRHICFLYLARTKVEWAACARWTPHDEN